MQRMSHWAESAVARAVLSVAVFVSLSTSGYAGSSRDDSARGSAVPQVTGQSSPRIRLLTFTPASAPALVRALDGIWAAPRPPGTIPNIAPDSFPRGMEDLPTADKKRSFLRAIAPHVIAANLWIAYERRVLSDVLGTSGDPTALAGPKRACLIGMTHRYRVTTDPDAPSLDQEVVAELRRRMDVVPPGLALAQAAIESGWGASRFTQLGNSLFGQWVFDRDKGMAPEKRPEGAAYAVARFENLAQSVGAYLHNLNTFSAYEDLRTLRSAMRRERVGLDSHDLAQGLLMYSERRDAYVEDVRIVLRSNGLAEFDGHVFARRSAGEWTRLLEPLDVRISLRQAGLVAPFPDPNIAWSPKPAASPPPASDG